MTPVEVGQVEEGLECIENTREAFHKINEPGMQDHFLFAKVTTLNESNPLQARFLLEQSGSIYSKLDWTWPLNNVFFP